MQHVFSLVFYDCYGINAANSIYSNYVNEVLFVSSFSNALQCYVIFYLNEYNQKKKRFYRYLKIDTCLYSFAFHLYHSVINIGFS